MDKAFVFRNCFKVPKYHADYLEKGQKGARWRRRVGPRKALLSAQNGCKNGIFPCKTREFSMKNGFSTFICFSPPFFVPTSTL